MRFPRFADEVRLVRPLEVPALRNRPGTERPLLGPMAGLCQGGRRGWSVYPSRENPPYLHKSYIKGNPS